MSHHSKDQPEDTGSPEWLKHAWNQDTIDWFLSLDEEEQYAVWDAFSLLSPSAYFDGSLDYSTLPSEPFINAALQALAGGEYSQKSEFVYQGGDMFLESLAYAYNMDNLHVMLINPGWFVGIRFSRERSEHLLRTYLDPATSRSGRTIGGRDRFRYLTLTHPDVPSDLALPHLKRLLTPEHADSDKYYFLTIWRRYLSFDRDADHLAELADLVEDIILADDGARNNDGDYFVGILRLLTCHPDFPESWVDRHIAMGYSDFPLLYPPHGEEAKAVYAEKYPTYGAKPKAVEEKTPTAFSNPHGISDETALAIGSKLVNEPVAEIPVDSLHTHTVGWYFESLRRIRDAMGVEHNIPDEWLKELL